MLICNIPVGAAADKHLSLFDIKRKVKIKKLTDQTLRVNRFYKQTEIINVVEDKMIHLRRYSRSALLPKCKYFNPYGLNPLRSEPFLYIVSNINITGSA